MRVLLTTPSVSYALALQAALEAEGIKAVQLDEQSWAILGLAARIRLAVADHDYDRAIEVIRTLELREPRLETPPSWSLQKRGLLVTGSGLVLLLLGGAVVGDSSHLLQILVLGVAFTVMVAGITLIMLAPRRDIPKP